MNERKQEAIVLLNDGEKNDKEGHCNSWPSLFQYDKEMRVPPYC